MDDNELSVEQQGEIVDEFLDGLLDAFGLDGEVEVDRVDDDTVEIRVDGEDLGLLIGPGGNTLTSLQELSKTVVQRHATGAHHGRIRVDVAGYRQRRREALTGFAQQVADEVRETGTQKGLEPMGAADRKVVHDAVSEVEGVATISEGQEPRRRVVIVVDEGD